MDASGRGHRARAIHRDTLAVAPGLRKRRTTGISRSKRGGVDPRAREAAREVIAEVGPGSTLAVLAEAVEKRCRALGVTPPSRGTIWQLGMEARGLVPVDAEGIEVLQLAIRSPGSKGDVPAIAKALRRRKLGHSEAIVADADVRDELIQAMPAGTPIQSMPP